MKSFKVYILVSLTLIFLVIGCSKASNEVKLITIPNRILIYYDGEQIEANSKHEDFVKIVDLTNDRVSKGDLSIGLDSVDIDRKVSGKKKTGISVEFIYNDEQETTIANSNGDFSIKYNRLFFQLSPDGDNFDDCFQYGDKDQYIGPSIEPIKESKDIINFIEDKFKK